MKMRFWQRTYLFTLLLFLLCLDIGMLSLTVYTYQKNVDAVETAVQAEQYYVAMNFERDHADMLELGGGFSDPVLLMQSFGAHYGKKGVYLSFKEEDTVLYSTFKEQHDIPENSLKHLRFEDGKRHLLISTTVCEGKYQLTVGKDVSDLDKELRSLTALYLLTAAGVSLLLAVCLYFILRKLSAPLEKLQAATDGIEAGDYSVTVPVEGDDEFTGLAKSFNAMVGKVNEQMTALELDAERKQMLVDNMAHELRTPLTGIQGYAEFLEKAAANEEQRILAAQYIISEAKRLQKISEILLDSGYIRGNSPEMTAVALSPVLEDVAEKLGLKALRAKVHLEFTPFDLQVMGNETLLSMLFYNLTENAIKACSSGGEVWLFAEGNAVVVKDNGKGMTEEQLRHVTEPFYRTDKSRSRAEGGAGLGLALCKQIVETHGAEMTFLSEIEKGTKISVAFTTLQQL